MRKSWLLSFLVIFIGIIVSDASHARYNEPENCTEIPFGSGRLFSITKPGLPKSYAFGTMHSGDPKIMQMPGLILQAFNAVNTLVVEISLADSNPQKSMSMMFRKPPYSLKRTIGASRFSQLEQIMASYKIPPELLDKMEIWAAATIVGQPPEKIKGSNNEIKYLDKELEKMARVQKKQVLSLETITEQLSLFADQPENLQIEILDEAIQDHVTLEEELGRMTDYYIRGKTGWIYCRMINQMKGSSRALNDFIRRTLLVDRNFTMVERIKNILPRGGIFIAVGALHMPGEKGILSMLQKEGYTVTRVY
ncbi:TraB/GumN family protein [Sneathiella sp.]|jgi:uncharacterized protein YbaP (TraB family)|uniref:TraB/GumN family protein n=1 Tax=Sneathiella sp. TaxID=1964365 RepID=UPI0039E5666D